MYTIQIVDAAGNVKQEAAGTGYARLLCTLTYQEGDAIAFITDERHCVIQVDQALPEALVYLPDKGFSFAIPVGDLKAAYPPQAFAGDMHLVQVRPARLEELRARHNLALNPVDRRFCPNCFPHASANVETRDEPAFFARNAIDGLKFNHSHGNWPFLSWGIGGRADAEITIQFGRTVRIDEVAVTLRADFPHDSWWTQGLLSFPDGQQMVLRFQKTGDTQYFETGEHLAEWVKLSDLKKSETPSPYAALSEWEVFGQDIL